MYNYFGFILASSLLIISACNPVSENALTKDDNQIVLECVDNYMTAIINKDPQLLSKVLVRYTDGAFSLGPEDAKVLANMNYAFGIKSYRIGKIIVKREISESKKTKVVLIEAELKLETRDGPMKTSLPLVYVPSGKYSKVLAPGITKTQR